MSSATTTPQPGAPTTDAGEADVEFRAVTKRFGSLVAVIVDGIITAARRPDLVPTLEPRAGVAVAA